VSEFKSIDYFRLQQMLINVDNSRASGAVLALRRGLAANGVALHAFLATLRAVLLSQGDSCDVLPAKLCSTQFNIVKCPSLEQAAAVPAPAASRGRKQAQPQLSSHVLSPATAHVLSAVQALTCIADIQELCANHVVGCNSGPDDSCALCALAFDATTTRAPSRITRSINQLRCACACVLILYMCYFMLNLCCVPTRAGLRFHC
jgi:hypothetical protein